MVDVPSGWTCSIAPHLGTVTNKFKVLGMLVGNSKAVVFIQHVLHLRLVRPEKWVSVILLRRSFNLARKL